MIFCLLHFKAAADDPVICLEAFETISLDDAQETISLEDDDLQWEDDPVEPG